MNQTNCSLLLAAIVLLVAFAPVVSAAETYVSRSVQVHDWHIGPQPSLADLEEIQSMGVGLVISTRLPEEMKKLDFDESQEIQSRGMRYLNIPVGGREYPFVPSMLETFTRAVDSSNEPILMHCRSGYRVSVLAAAYLVKQQGVAIDVAIESVGNQRVEAETVKLVLAN
jgi:uncharacterized protein (TIGR01244 family)